MVDKPCKFCTEPVPLSATLCPHCGRPSLFPNVEAAGDDAERAALTERYRNAVKAAVERGCAAVLKEFEKAASRSQAVIARPLEEAERLASSDDQLYSTYYKLIEAGVRMPPGEKWDSLRQLADVCLFGAFNAYQIRFAALSLDDSAPTSYGACCLVLREDRIAHRASLFQDDSAVFLAGMRYDLPAGYRAVWDERAMLCIAKLAEKLQVDTPSTQFPTLLMRNGATSAEDWFVEVHIWGPMTRRTLQKVRLMAPPGKGRPYRARLKALRDRLAEVRVEFETPR
jgi:hypothetical protein